jgi:catalase
MQLNRRSSISSSRPIRPCRARWPRRKHPTTKNTFVFVNNEGERRAVRYIMTPAKLVHLDPAEAAKKARDFLVDELAARLAQAPVNFRLKVQLASPGDTRKDPSQPWPNRNEVVELGVLTIDKPVAEPRCAHSIAKGERDGTRQDHETIS